MALRRQGPHKVNDFFVYILWSDRLKKYYVGSTNNLNSRLDRHNKGQSKFTSKGVPWALIWNCSFTSRKEAFNLESKIKSRGIKRFLDDVNSGSSAGR